MGVSDCALDFSSGAGKGAPLSKKIAPVISRACGNDISQIPLTSGNFRGEGRKEDFKGGGISKGNGVRAQVGSLCVVGARAPVGLSCVGRWVEAGHPQLQLIRSSAAEYS